MRAELQQQIAPHMSNNSKDIITGVPSEQPEIKPKVDFQSILANSNADAAKARKKTESNNLKDFESYDAFLENLHKQSMAKREPKSSLDKDDFMHLFVTQLQQQDPLNPQDGAEMASQLAEFNGLEQMINMNQSIKELQKINENQKTKVIDFMEKEVVFSTDNIKISKEGQTSVFYKLDEPADNLQITIKDQEDKIVFEQKIPNVKDGENFINWDGTNAIGEKAPEGVYSVAVSRKDPQGRDIPIETKGKVSIEAINFKDQANPIFKTKLGLLTLGDIEEVHNPQNKSKAIALEENKPSVEQIPEQLLEAQPPIIQAPIQPPITQEGLEPNMQSSMETAQLVPEKDAQL